MFNWEYSHSDSDVTIMISASTSALEEWKTNKTGYSNSASKEVAAGGEVFRFKMEFNPVDDRFQV